MEQGNSSRTSQASVSAALTAASGALRNGAVGVRFLGEDGGQSLADMAQRDLDAALQLLTDRAQYITGSTGAAIALRRSGKNDMMCRATTGSNAPELGVLLSTEYGLSGESVRTRRALRCDDAERDARVNREVCRELGIASVVVMPVVHDDEVLGVFELFSGKPMAFGERDVSALARLSEMVETAVTLARAAVASEHMENATPVADSAIAASSAVIREAQISEANSLIEDSLVEVETEVATVAPADKLVENPVKASESDKAAEDAKLSQKQKSDQQPTNVEARAWPTGPQSAAVAAAAAAAPVTSQPVPSLETPEAPAAPAAALRSAVLRTDLQPPAADVPSPNPTSANLSPSRLDSVNFTDLTQPEAAPAKKPLLWSSALNAAEAQKTNEADRSHVPAAFRNLSQCQACGFPISSGRVLCVECEEKKWRGQLKMPATPVAPTAAGMGSGAAAAPAPALADPKPNLAKPNLRKPLPKAKLVTTTTKPAPAAPVSAQIAAIVAPTQPTTRSPLPPPVFTAVLEPSQSWLARNKYMIGALLLVAAVVAAIAFFR
jgi:GAF domain-containing protein